MTTNYCEAIQREIDEANLDEGLTSRASEHLRQCENCRRFHHERHTLRNLMAELETVGAPADFDFRLRARLARENPGNGFRGLLQAARPLAAIALVLLLVVAAVVVKNQLSRGRRQTVDETAAYKKDTPGSQFKVAKAEESPAEVKVNPTEKGAAAQYVASDKSPQSTGSQSRPKQRTTNPSLAIGPRTAVRESALNGAPVTVSDATAGMVEVPIDGQVFRLSIENGRGVARTISLPSVSFGSQRLLPRDASYIRVSSGKGDW